MRGISSKPSGFFYIRIILLLAFALPTAAMAGYKEDFEKAFLTEPWAVEQAERSACIECHASEVMRPEFLNIPKEWKMSLHYENNVSCHACHGGDPEDASMAMSPQRGFIGAPKYTAVPQFCGKCHIGILKNYLESGHGKALKATGSGPNCVTCHGSHNIQKATIDIINEQRCTQCHSYERAKIMKQALFLTEKKIRDIENDIKKLRAGGVFTEDEEKTLFSTHAEFRTLFHTVDVSLVKERTDEFLKKLSLIEDRTRGIFKELRFRKNLSVFFMLVFIGMAAVIFLLSKTYK